MLLLPGDVLGDGIGELAKDELERELVLGVVGELDVEDGVDFAGGDPGEGAIGGGGALEVVDVDAVDADAGLEDISIA